MPLASFGWRCCKRAAFVFICPAGTRAKGASPAAGGLGAGARLQMVAVRRADGGGGKIHAVGPVS